MGSGDIFRCHYHFCRKFNNINNSIHQKTLEKRGEKVKIWQRIKIISKKNNEQDIIIVRYVLKEVKK